MAQRGFAFQIYARGSPTSTEHDWVNFKAHIARNPEICGGEAIIVGTRVTLRTILASLAEGDTIEDILADFPTLTEADVRCVIAYAAASAAEDLGIPWVA